VLASVVGATVGGATVVGATVVGATVVGASVVVVSSLGRGVTYDKGPVRTSRALASLSTCSCDLYGPSW